MPQDSTTPTFTREQLAQAMQRARLLEDPVPPAALRWIDTFVEAYGTSLTIERALEEVSALRAEAVIVPALPLERLRSRQVLFFLDTVSQYVDSKPELRGLRLTNDLIVMAQEFGLERDDALWAVRMAITGRDTGAALELLFPLLGHDRIMMRVGAVNSHLLHGRGLEPIAFGPDGKPFVPLQGHAPPDHEPARGGER